MCEMIDDPGRSLIIATFGSTGGMGRSGEGMCGGYPGVNDVIYFAHDTNMRELVVEGKSYPTDFVEVREWLKSGKLRAGSVEVYQGSTPNIECRDGDIFATATAAQGGWGDPLERELGRVEEDVLYGWVTPGVARAVYGVIIGEDGKARLAESDELRKQMRNVRKEKSLDAREWWKQERERVLRQDFSDDVYNMYADIVKYDKFRIQFMGMWQLSDAYQFEGLRL